MRFANISLTITKVDAVLTSTNSVSLGTPELIRTDDLMLHFKCECSDENCDTRIPIKLSVYQKIHENRDAFIIKLKHQVNEIEKVILTEDFYSVVEKNNSTAEPTNTLNVTTIENKDK